MALVVFDGFDHYGSQTDLQARNGALQWDDIAAGNVSFATGRGGSGLALVVGAAPLVGLDTNGIGCSFRTNYASGVCGVATKALSGLQCIDYCFMDYVNNVRQLTIRCFMNSGVIQAWAGNPNLPSPFATSAVYLGSSAPNAFSPYVWNSVEILATIGASGSFTMAVNGTPVFGMSNVQTEAPASQVPAPYTPNAWFNGFRIGFGLNGTSQAEVAYIDDFRLSDTTVGPGTYPLNGFIGDVAVRVTYPVSNNSVQWTPNAGQNWQEVSEVQFDGDGSFNVGATVGSQDLFNFGSLPAGVPVVYGVQATGAYRKVQAGNQTIQQSIVSSGTTQAGANNVMSVNYTYYTDLFTVDPSTGATWTPTAVSAIVAGYQKTG